MKFLGKLYTKPERNSWRTERLDCSPISAQSIEWLDRPLLEKEVQSAVSQLSRDKALSPDGYTVVLCQEHWNVKP